jgi:hypothetical protein
MRGFLSSATCPASLSRPRPHTASANPMAMALVWASSSHSATARASAWVQGLGASVSCLALRCPSSGSCLVSVRVTAFSALETATASGCPSFLGAFLAAKVNVLACFPAHVLAASLSAAERARLARGGPSWARRRRELKASRYGGGPLLVTTRARSGVRIAASYSKVCPLGPRSCGYCLVCWECSYRCG